MAEDQSLVSHLLFMLGQESWWDNRTQETGIILLGCMAGLMPDVEQQQQPQQSALVCASILSHIPSDDLTMAGMHYYRLPCITTLAG